MLISQACKLNFKSPFTWHINGIVLKEMKLYPEACKAFSFAHRFDPDNMSVLR